MTRSTNVARDDGATAPAGPTPGVQDGPLVDGHPFTTGEGGRSLRHAVSWMGPKRTTPRAR